MDKFLNKLSRASIDASKHLKGSPEQKFIRYLMLTSTNFYSMLASVIFELEDKTYTYKNEFIRGVNKVGKRKFATLLKLNSLEYLLFLKYNTSNSFKDKLPVDVDQLIDTFYKTINSDKQEKGYFKEISDNFELAKHSRIVLELLNFPKDADNDYFIKTMEEMKPVIYDQINKSAVKILEVNSI